MKHYPKIILVPLKTISDPRLVVEHSRKQKKESHYLKNIGVRLINKLAHCSSRSKDQIEALSEDNLSSAENDICSQVGGRTFPKAEQRSNTPQAPLRTQRATHS